MKMESYKMKFKYFKRKCPPPDLSTVIDVRRNAHQFFSRRDVPVCNISSSSTVEKKYGLKPCASWKVYEFLHNKGLIFIENPFTAVGQRYWCCRCLRDYTCKPQKLNIDAHNDLTTDENWWDVCMKGGSRSEKIQKKLRWATLGYHHNWDTKVYSEDERDVFPSDLAELTQFIARVLGFEDFKAEAAIVNFYHMDSTLSGHTDVSEAFKEAPLFSFSFGQSAIFLLGGETMAEDPAPILLCSGDIVVMSGRSRLCFHGVPRILSAKDTPWSQDLVSECLSIKNGSISDSSNFMEENPAKRIKRECVDTGILNSDENKSKNSVDERSNLEQCVSNDMLIDNKLLKECCSETFWKNFKKYVENSRININVRQVLRPGQNSLHD